MPVMMTMMTANTFLTYAEVDHAGNDDDDESVPYLCRGGPCQ